MYCNNYPMKRKTYTYRNTQHYHPDTELSKGCTTYSKAHNCNTNDEA